MMAEKKHEQPELHEEIEWTPEDDAIMDKVWANLRKKLNGKLPSQVKREQEEARKQKP
jgi:predicted Fe-S protein YdhL (DUF1289 family)